MRSFAPWFRRFTLAGFAFVVSNQAVDPTSSSVPVLRIETGSHATPIRALRSNTAAGIVVTAAQDKVVRVWDRNTGQLLQTLRQPYDESFDYEVGLDISPDGRLVAVSGVYGSPNRRDYRVHVFDRQSASIAYVIDGLPNAVGHVAFSLDGRFLALCPGNTTGPEFGMRVYHASDGSFHAGDAGYRCSALAAGPNGQFAATDCKPRAANLRLYRVGESGVSAPDIRRLENGMWGGRLSFAPDGRQLAMTYGYEGYSNRRVEVVALPTLIALRHLGASDIPTVGDTRDVAWLGDGRVVASVTDRKQGNALLFWSLSDGAVQLRRSWAHTLLSDRDDELIVASGSGFMVVNDRLDTLVRSAGPIRRSLAEGSLKLDGRGEVVEFTSGGIRRQFDMTRRALVTNASGLEAAVDSAAGLAFTDWTTGNGALAKLNGIKLTSLGPFPLGGYRSASVCRSGELAIMAGGKSIQALDRSTKVLWRTAPMPSSWLKVVLSGDCKLLAAASDDGEISWFRTSDGTAFLHLFWETASDKWVAWSPSGYYDASPGGEDLIGWHINRGIRETPSFFPASRFRAKFYRPDVIDRLLETVNETEALRLADQSASRRPDGNAVNVQAVLPPSIAIVSPADRTVVTTTQIKIAYSTRAPNDAPVTRLRVRINNLPVALPEAHNLAVAAGAGTREITLPIPPRDSEIQLFAENRNGVSTPAALRVVWKSAALTKRKDEFDMKPVLYVLAVGVSDYDNPQYKLGLAAKDAQDFAAAVQKQKGMLYRDVVVKLLTNKGAGRDAVLDGLDWLRKEVTAKDVGMLFLSGHGLNDADGVYYYMPANADLDRLKSTGVVFTEIRNTLANLAGKALFFVDTCHSGNILGGRRALAGDITGVINELTSAENGVVVFSSSTGRQYSLEDAAWGNGAFTKALVEGINGKAALNKDGRITHKMLDFYLSERVKELTKGQQTPVTQAPGGVPDFPIALSK